MGVSVAVHAVAIFIVLLLVTMGPPPPVVTDTLTSIPADIIWRTEPGPGGGGGGGGNQMKEPPRKAELPGKEKLSVPVVRPPEIAPPKQEKPPEPPKPEFNIPAKTTAAGAEPLPGVLVTQQALNTPSTGTGYGRWRRHGPRHRHRPWRGLRSRSWCQAAAPAAASTASAAEFRVPKSFTKSVRRIPPMRCARASRARRGSPPSSFPTAASAAPTSSARSTARSASTRKRSRR